MNNKASATEALNFIKDLPPAVIVETYMLNNGKFYFPLLDATINNFSTSTWCREFEKKLGWFTNGLVSENEVSEEEFREIYVFGKFEHTRLYIPYIYKITGKLLTRQKLFEYLLK